MDLELAETLLRRAGGLLAFFALVVVFYGIWRGTRHPSGRTSGRAADWLRSALFYFLATAGFMGISIGFWKSLPLNLPPGVHLALLVAGSVIYFPGMAFLLWARLVLGKMYFVSTSFGAQLYADHELVTNGPFAIVRHPMYLGLIAAALGSLLLYRTWTALAYALFAPFVLLRARREELALSAEFGEEWRAYCQRVPALMPRFRRERAEIDRLLPEPLTQHSELDTQQCLKGGSLSETTYQDLSGVTETLLMILAIRAFESQRPDALIKDERAEALIGQMDQDFLRKKLAKVEDYSRVAMILRSRDFDRHAQDFLARHPDAVVVHIGCGLDTRFERVCSEQPDNGQVEWYDLDLPEVIALRRRLIGGEGERYHLLGCSMLDSIWLDTVSAHRQRPFLFLAEGVFMYLEEAQVKSLVLIMKEHFPGAELVFDAFSPFLSLANNFRVALTRVGARSHWALKDGKDLEKWGDPSTSLKASAIRLLDERFPYQYPEPRLDRALVVRHNPFFARAIGVFHYQL